MPPAAILVSFEAFAASIASLWPWRAVSSRTAPMEFLKSLGSPIFIASTSASSSSLILARRSEGTRAREAALSLARLLQAGVSGAPSLGR